MRAHMHVSPQHAPPWNFLLACFFDVVFYCFWCPPLPLLPPPPCPCRTLAPVMMSTCLPSRYRWKVGSALMPSDMASLRVEGGAGRGCNGVIHRAAEPGTARRVGVRESVSCWVAPIQGGIALYECKAEGRMVDKYGWVREAGCRRR